MDRPQLQAKPRTSTNNKSLRRQGFVPVAIEQHGKESLAYQVEYDALKTALVQVGKHDALMITPEGSDSVLVLAQEIHYDPVSRKLWSVCFKPTTEKEAAAVSQAAVEAAEAAEAEKAHAVDNAAHAPEEPLHPEEPASAEVPLVEG